MTYVCRSCKYLWAQLEQIELFPDLTMKMTIDCPRCKTKYIWDPDTNAQENMKIVPKGDTDGFEVITVL